jgi:cytosine/uracil/thiamine/allantoin permease
MTNHRPRPVWLVPLVLATLMVMLGMAAAAMRGVPVAFPVLVIVAFGAEIAFWISLVRAWRQGGRSRA